MRVIWLLGGDESHVELLSNAFSASRFSGVSYLVRRAEKIEEIPKEHLAEAGVCILLDAFNPDYLGFNGLDALTEVGCQARCFLLGEPAPEQAGKAFGFDFFAGYFPPLDRVDFSFISGIVHNTLFFNGKIEIKHFLSQVGKSSSEMIASFEDFRAFEKLLSEFVSRFGIDKNQLRKMLMGLTVQHTSTSGGKLSISEPFEVFYGIDPNKLLVAVGGLSKGAAVDVFREEFVNAVVSADGSGGAPAKLFPELVHAARSSKNLIVFSGSGEVSEPTLDPMILLSRVNFPKKESKSSGLGHIFANTFVFKTEEMSEEWARIEVKPGEEVKVPAPKENGDSGSAKSIDENQIAQILSEPSVSGDSVQSAADITSPQRRPGMADVLDESTSVGSSGSTFDASGGAGQLNADHVEIVKKHQLADRALQDLNKVCSALAKDVQDLLKMRRQPTTDRELRAVKEKLEKQIVSLTGELQKHKKMTDTQRTEIKELKERVKKLISEKSSEAA